jgi:serine/threonine protein kinase
MTNVGAAPSRPSPLVPGYYLDRYELLCPLAEGGMGSVWVSRLIGKHGFEKHVAIKTLLPQFATDDRFRTMFLDEARIASRIQHTNVAQILDLGEQHEILYLVMEYVDGDSLSRLARALARKKMQIPQNILLRAVADACGGLHAAHELAGPDGAPLGVVHRDVSPQNILISTLGTSKLIDFGIAKARDRAGGDTNAGILKGKLNYMAPEQAIGATMDRRTDIFAVGAVLYHLLAGHPPFEGENQLATLHKLTSTQPPTPMPKSVPPAVVAVVKRALARKREERFRSAAELQAAIEAAMLQSHLTCTTSEVARFVKEHLAERMAKRKAAIDLALAAAAERQRIREKLRPPMSEASMVQSASSSGPIGALSEADLRALQALAETSSPGAASASGVIPSPEHTGSPITLKPAVGRRGLLAVAVGATLVLAVAGTLTLQSILRQSPAPQTIVVLSAAPPTTVVVPPPPPPTTSAVSIDDIPSASAETPAVSARHKVRHTAPASTEPANRERHRGNYGF